MRSTSQGGAGALGRDLRERQLQLVDRVAARLVDAGRLAGRAHEQPGK